MTYAGLKSMIYAGLKPDDPRVKAASEYIAKHYTLEENPGMGQAGLFYYYQTFAKALTLLNKANFRPTPKASPTTGRPIWWPPSPWRQAADGSWVNTADRFMEGDPNLVTA